MAALKSEIRGNMRIEWGVPIEMDDGIVLRADVFRPISEGMVPVGYRLGLTIRGRDYVAPFAQPHPIYDKGRQAPNGVGILFHDEGDDRRLSAPSGET